MEFGITLKYGNLLLEATKEDMIPVTGPCWQPKEWRWWLANSSFKKAQKQTSIENSKHRR